MDPVRKFYTLEYFDSEDELVVEHLIKSEEEIHLLLEQFRTNKINVKIYDLQPDVIDNKLLSE